MRKITILVTTFLLSVCSCKKNELIQQVPQKPFETGKNIITNIAGKITAQDGTALSHVTITIGNNTTTTDVSGCFIIPKATINKNAGLIKATKQGYFTGIRTIIAKENVINNIAIQLIKKTQAGSFINANGGNITAINGGNISFAANAIATKTGAAYTGTVNVFAYYLDPTSTNCFKEMPGDLRGINTSNNELALSSYGMMNVELMGSNGEELQIATGKQATLTMPINNSIINKATTTIPLWYFDETKAVWVEQGIATKTGNNYVGNVNHFTWWNCDAPCPIIDFKIKFIYNIDDSGGGAARRIYPAANVVVSITTKSTNNAWSGTVYNITASDGSIEGMIPYNEQLEIKVFADPQCTNNTPIYTGTYGAYTQNTDAGTVVIPKITTVPVANITGTVVNCNNQPVTNGYAIITLNNSKYYEQINNGNINKAIVGCTSSIVGTANIEVYDMDSLKKNINPISANVSGAGVYNLGSLRACGLPNSDEYLIYGVNGVFTFDTTFSIFIDSNKTTILGDLNKYRTNKTQFALKMIQTKLTTTGKSYNNYFDYRDDYNFGVFHWSYSKIEILEFGNIGGFIKGTFSDSMYLGTYFSGSFRIKRTQ